MKRTRYAILALLLLVSSAMLLRASLPVVATGTWQSGAAMSEVRTGAATAGLPSGQVLMTGGTTAGGGITNSAEVFDPASNSWSGLAAVMQDPRSGHTASALADGRVLLAGGENSGSVIGTLEVYDPASQSFSSVGAMLAARKNHGAAVLKDGRVWLVGGSDGTNALASSEIYDPADGSVTAGPNLPAPRSGLSATTLLDGTVLIAGGNNAAQGDLASTLIYDPTAGSFTPGASLSAARSSHTAILLPLNNEVLIAGGSAAGSDLASAELYVPWTSAVQATAAMGAARSGAAGSGFKDHDGRAMVAGGSGLASSEYYGFATVKTDKADYAPGEYAKVSGSGWQPGETITLTFHEDLATPFHADEVVTTVADVFGNISGVQYLLEDHDAGVRYYLTAVGASSVARTTFTDTTYTSSVTQTGPAPTSVAPGATLSWSATAVCTGASGPPGTPCISIPSTYTIELRQFSDAACGITIGAQPVSSGSGASTGTLTFSAPSSPGTYYYKARHPSSTIGGNPWPTANATACNSVTVVSDATPPVITPTVTGTLGSNGWYTSNVDVSWTVTDPESTVTSTTGCGPTTISADTTGITLTCSATSAGGTSSSSVTIKRDATAPTGSIVINSGDTYTNSTSVALVIVRGDTGTTEMAFSNDGSTYSAFEAFSATKAYTLPGGDGAKTVYVKLRDLAGNTAVFSDSIVLDATAPSITATPSPVANANGWNNTDVTVSYSCTDASGVNAGASSLGNDVLSSSGTASGTCVDNAGNSASASYTAQIDKVKPVITGSRTPDANTFGWNNVDVVVSFSCSDSGGSEIDTNTVAGATVSAEGAGQSVTNTGSCVDVAGNTADAATVSGINIDKTAPTAVVTPDRGADHDPWYNHTLSFVTSGSSDALSGIDSCTAVGNYSGPDSASASVSTTCTDKAGNSANGSFSFKYDGTAPTATIAVSAGTAGLHGWYTSDVTVHTSGTDATSGIDSCTADQFQTTETSGQSFTGHCTDNAGNTSADASLTVKLDKTGPSAALSVTAGTLGLNGWYVSDVTISTSGTDSISNPTSCTGDQSQTTDTTGHEFHGSCTNDAGLTTDAASLTIKRDATPPSITLTTPPAGASYTLNAAVASDYSCSDATSGVASCTGTVANGANISTNPVGAHSFTVNATDVAGNSATPVTHNYNVTYIFVGFLPPIDNLPISNLSKAGQTIPIKWQLKDANGNLVSDLNSLAVNGLQSGSIPCSSQDPAAVVEELTSPGATVFRFDGTQFIYNWQTPKNWAGTCRMMQVTLADGTMHYAKFSFK